MNEDKYTLLEQFRRMEALLHRYIHQARRKHGPYGDTLRGQGRVLSLLKMQPEISQKELSYLLDIRSQSLGELLSKLEKSGLIERTPSGEDKRMMMVRLTEQGRAVADTPQVSEAHKLFDVLSEEEQQQLAALMEKLIAGLMEVLDSDVTAEELERGYGMDMRPPFGRAHDGPGHGMPGHGMPGHGGPGHGGPGHGGPGHGRCGRGMRGPMSDPMGDPMGRAGCEGDPRERGFFHPHRPAQDSAE